MRPVPALTSPEPSDSDVPDTFWFAERWLLPPVGAAPSAVEQAGVGISLHTGSSKPWGQWHRGQKAGIMSGVPLWAEGPLT